MAEVAEVAEVMVEVTTRRCFSCGEEKPLEEFHKNKGKPLGRSYMCKTCRRACDRAQNQRPERIEKFKQYRQEESTVEKHRVYSRRAYLNCPEATKARALIARLIKLGLITRLPCQICGEEKTDAHHPDYAKPLEVAWLCRSHHFQADRILRGSNETMPAFTICSYSMFTPKMLDFIILTRRLLTFCQLAVGGTALSPRASRPFLGTGDSFSKVLQS